MGKKKPLKSMKKFLLNILILFIISGSAVAFASPEALFEDANAVMRAYAFRHNREFPFEIPSARPGKKGYSGKDLEWAIGSYEMIIKESGGWDRLYKVYAALALARLWRYEDLPGERRTLGILLDGRMRIAKIIDGGPATKRKRRVKIGDVLEEVNGKFAGAREEVRDLTDEFAGGETIWLKIRRDRWIKFFKIDVPSFFEAEGKKIFNDLSGSLRLCPDKESVRETRVVLKLLTESGCPQIKRAANETARRIQGIREKINFSGGQQIQARKDLHLPADKQKAREFYAGELSQILAKFYYREGRFSEAVKEYERLDDLWAVVDCYGRLRQWDKPIKACGVIYKEAIKTEDIRQLKKLARWYDSFCLWKEALALYQEISSVVEKRGGGDLSGVSEAVERLTVFSRKKPPPDLYKKDAVFAWRGIRVSANTPLHQTPFRNLDSSKGVVIIEVLEGSFAQDAGIEAGDMVEGIEGIPIEVNCLQNFVAAVLWAEYKKEKLILKVRRKDLSSILIVDMGS